MESLDQFNSADHFDLLALLLAAEEQPALRERPEYEQALARVQGEESLREWYEQERDYYARHSGLLAGAGLSDVSRERISQTLQAAGSAQARVATDVEALHAPSNSVADVAPVAGAVGRRSLLPFALPIAALLAVGLGLLFVLSSGSGDAGPKPANPFEQFQHFAASNIADRSFSLEKRTPDVEAATAWLRGKSAPGVGTSPGGTRAMTLPTAGCTLLEWNGHPVSLICMKPKGQPMVHLFAVSRQAVDLLPAGGVSGETRQWRRHPTRSWADAETAYVLVGHKRSDTLEVPQTFEIPESGA